MRYSILICCLLALVSCASLRSQASQGAQAVNTPSRTVLPLSKQAAVDRAIALASQPQPELNAAQAPPRLVQAEQMTLVAAFQRFLNGDSVAAGNDPNLSVWVIKLEGVWTSGMPAPPDVPAPEPYRHYIVILNVITGDDIAIAAQP